MRITTDIVAAGIPVRNPNPPSDRYNPEYPRETKWQSEVAGWFKKMGGWATYHTYKSTHSTAGFPDLFCIHATTGRRLWAELKTETGTLTADQIRWLGLLANSGEEVYLWRPSDTDEIHAVLKQANDDAFHLRERGFIPKRRGS